MDIWLQELKEYVIKDLPCNRKEINQGLRPYWMFDDELEMIVWQ